MNPDDIRRLFPRASASLFAANAPHPELSLGEDGQAPVVRPELERDSRDGALGKSKAKVRDSRRFLVRVTSIRARLIDEDNLCEKYVVDCCRAAALIPGDGPSQTRIETSQRKAGKGEDEGTLIEIFEFIAKLTHAAESGRSSSPRTARARTPQASHFNERGESRRGGGEGRAL